MYAWKTPTPFLQLVNNRSSVFNIVWCLNDGLTVNPIFFFSLSIRGFFGTKQSSREATLATWRKQGETKQNKHNAERITTTASKMGERMIHQ